MSDPAHVLVVAHQTAATSGLIDTVRARAQRSPATFHLVVPRQPHGMHKLVDPQDTGEDEAQHVLAEALEGLSFVWNNAFLRLTTLMLMLGTFAVAGVQLAIVVLAKQHGLTSAAIGLLVALVGATTLLGAAASPLVRRLLSPRAILLSEFWASLALVSFLVWPSVYVLAAAFAFQAFFFANTDAAVRAYWYAMTPDRLIARVPSAMGNVMVSRAAQWILEPAHH